MKKEAAAPAKDKKGGVAGKKIYKKTQPVR